MFVPLDRYPLRPSAALVFNTVEKEESRLAFFNFHSQNQQNIDFERKAEELKSTRLLTPSVKPSHQRANFDNFVLHLKSPLNEVDINAGLPIASLSRQTECA